MPTKRVTLADVARQAGVSQTAASFVLAGRRQDMRISAEVEERVLQAVRETGYRPNILSRSLRTGTSHTIGFVSDTVSTTPFAGHLIWGALDAARELGHLLLIAETEGDRELEQQLVEAMHDRQVDGIVLASMYTRTVRPPKALLDAPAVLLNALPQGRPVLPSVVPDEAGAGRTAARVLLDAGHRDGICLIGAGPGAEAPKDSIAAIERLQGILETLQSAGVQVAAAVGCSSWQPDHGFEATRRLLRAHPRPSALICFNDRLAVGAYQALADAGLEVPADVSVVSFDDDVFASWIRPQLTTVALPHYELGRAAVERLLDQAGSSDARKPGIHRIPMPLRDRSSVRNLTRSRPEGHTTITA
ncbi:MAG TPA: LacI family DNA-binding transcriptional regulator [Streptosporangiaceae bacterium]|nr:LacI family DNA-binding transcriptional regulator [Streptosporangiaceae bacterium]